MEKILFDTNEQAVNDYLSKGWKVKMMNTPVSLGGSSSMFFPTISLCVVLEKDQEEEDETEQETTQEATEYDIIEQFFATHKTEQIPKGDNKEVEYETTHKEKQVDNKVSERARCSIDGCDGWVHKEGICHFHYFQKYNHF